MAGLMWKRACLILFLLSAGFIWTSALLGMAYFNDVPSDPAPWLLMAIPLVPLYGWWRIRSMEVTAEDIERSR